MPFLRVPVDAGTIELVRSFGIELVSSADLVQRFEAVWTPEQWSLINTLPVPAYDHRRGF
jgi:hypothetical protein